MQAAVALLDESARYERIPAKLEERLMAFQRDGVRFALRHGGRALIGDEMGLGKTVQVGVQIPQSTILHFFQGNLGGWPMGCHSIVPRVCSLLMFLALFPWQNHASRLDIFRSSGVHAVSCCPCFTRRSSQCDILAVARHHGREVLVCYAGARVDGGLQR